MHASHQDHSQDRPPGRLFGPKRQPEEALQPPGRPLMPVFRILAVDDSASIVELLALTLQDMGHDVRTAESGFDALLQLEMDPPDVIISDIAMPAISGHELARRIRSDRRWGKIALVGISGMGQPRDAEAALKAGFDYFLVKPAQIEEIEKIFRAIAWRAESLKSKEEPE